jgi:hypothetical protein
MVADVESRDRVNRCLDVLPGTDRPAILQIRIKGKTDDKSRK